MARLTDYPALTGLRDGATTADPMTAVSTADRDGDTAVAVTLTDEGVTLTLSLWRDEVTFGATSPDGGLVRLPESLTLRGNALLKGLPMSLHPDWRKDTAGGHPHAARVPGGRRMTLVSGQTYTVSVTVPGPTPAVPVVTPHPAPVTGSAPATGSSAEALAGANLLSDRGAFSGEVWVHPSLATGWALARNAHQHSLPGHLLIAGPPGSAKTHAAMVLSAQAGRIPVVVECQNLRDIVDLWGGTDLVDGAKGTVSVFRPTTAYWAVALPGPRTLILDEVNRASGEVQNALLPLLMGARTLTMPHGERVVVAPDLQIVVTANIGSEYTGTVVMDPALRDRFAYTAHVDYPPADIEVGILRDRMALHGVDLPYWKADKFVAFANEVRKAAKRGEVQPVTTRSLLAAAAASAVVSPLEAIEAAVLGDYSRSGGDLSEYQTVVTMASLVDWSEPVEVEPPAEAYLDDTTKEAL